MYTHTPFLNTIRLPPGPGYTQPPGIPACSQHSCSAGAAHASLTTTLERTGAPVGPGRARRAAALLSARVRTRAGRAGGGCGARRGPARRGAARRGRGGRAAPRPRHGGQRLPAAAGGASAPLSNEALETRGSGACESRDVWVQCVHSSAEATAEAPPSKLALSGSPWVALGARAPSAWIPSLRLASVRARTPTALATRAEEQTRARTPTAHATPNEEGEGSGGYRALGERNMMAQACAGAGAAGGGAARARRHAGRGARRAGRRAAPDRRAGAPAAHAGAPGAPRRLAGRPPAACLAALLLMLRRYACRGCQRGRWLPCSGLCQKSTQMHICSWRLSSADQRAEAPAARGIWGSSACPARAQGRGGRHARLRRRPAQATDAEETQRDAAALGDLSAELAAAEEREAAEAARARAAERAAAAAEDARRRMEADLQQARGVAALPVCVRDLVTDLEHTIPSGQRFTCNCPRITG